MESVKFNLPSFFQRTRKTHVGIDIGTSAIKIVEVARRGNDVELVNYGELKNYHYLQHLRGSSQGAAMAASEGDLASTIRQVLDAAGISQRSTSLSIPLVSAFFTTLELPPMSRTELQEAITYQARQIVPVPIPEVILDWELIGRIGKVDDGTGPKEKILILLVAVPREVVDRYVRIAKLAALQLDALEVEAFSMVRAALRGDRRTVLLVDIGARATNLLLVSGESIRMSHVLETGGSDFTDAVANALRVDRGRAETEKIEQGMAASASSELRQLLATTAGNIAQEMGRMAAAYQRTSGSAIEAVVLAGGSGGMEGMDAFLSGRFSVPTERVNPFSHIRAPEELEPVLRELGPSFAVATGLALRPFVPALS